MKVKLSDDEIKKYSLYEIESERVEIGMRKGLWQLMDIAKARHGFSLSGEKLLIQFYKTDLGGELFVTKLSRQSQRAEKLLDGASNITLLKEESLILRFADADSVIRALLVLGASEPYGAQLYFSDDECYYLVCTVRGGAFSDIGFLSEFGEQVPEEVFPAILEHSRLLAKNGELSQFFSSKERNSGASD